MKITISLIAALAFASPAYALTLQQAQNELAGMYCSGSTCTSKTAGTVTTDNPDIITSTQVLVSPAGNETKRTLAVESERGFWNERCQTIAYVNADCTVQSIADHDQGGGNAIYTTVTSITDGGVTVTATCTTTSKTLSYNGPNTSRDTAWSVSTSTSTSEGGC